MLKISTSNEGTYPIEINGLSGRMTAESIVDLYRQIKKLARQEEAEEVWSACGDIIEHMRQPDYQPKDPAIRGGESILPKHIGYITNAKDLEERARLDEMINAENM